ncbi:hypothetical protein [Sulfitobacter sp.]|uniref:hypothetical protein n=1 Tax=Sulfitobacter sp. TaxID=1903071 RepID=UPI003EFA0225
MRVESERAQADRKLWCANRSSYIDLSPFYEGKSDPVNGADIYFPFSGRPELMKHFRPALEGYAGTIGESSLRLIQTYLNSLFTFITTMRPDCWDIADIAADLFAEHCQHMSLAGLTVKNRASMHGCGNGILKHLHARYRSVFPNLSKDGRPIRYPSIKMGSSLPRSRSIPIDVEPFVKRYCLQILGQIDENPFLSIEPKFGVDVMNPAHVLYDFLLFEEERLRCGKGGPWKCRKAGEFPWRSCPNVSVVTKRAKELGRKSGNLWCGGSVGQMKEALFPTSEEIIASVILVTLDVGWIDTAKAFSFDSPWYTTSAKDPLKPASSEYVALISRIRSKTSREIWSKAANAKKGGSWWTLQRIQERTRRLRTLCQAQAAFLKDQSASQRNDDLLRLKFERWQDLACLAFIYYGSRSPNSAIKLDGSKWSSFLRNIPQLAEFDIPKEHLSFFDRITHYDLRHIVAHRTLKESGFFATQQLLGHVHGTTTMGYLASRQLKAELFAAYARVTGIAFEEIKGKVVLNRAIIQKRFVRNGDELTLQERQELGVMTLQGARCKEPTDISSPSASRSCKTR